MAEPADETPFPAELGRAELLLEHTKRAELLSGRLGRGKQLSGQTERGNFLGDCEM